MKISSNIKFKEVELFKILVGECFMFNNDIYIKTSGFNSNDNGMAIRAVELQTGRLVLFNETEIVNPIKAEIKLFI